MNSREAVYEMAKNRQMANKLREDQEGIKMHFQQSNANLDKLIKLYLPQDSAITRVQTNERFGSIVVDIHHIVPAEYQKEHDLTSRRRILSIRLIQGERDKGQPINSFADTD